MFFQQLISGLAVGCVYALIALGYTMVYGILRFINFAHGGIFTWGSYFGWMAIGALIGMGMPTGPAFILATAIAAAMTALLGVCIEKIAYRPIRHAGFLPPFMTSLGVSLFLMYGAMILWTPNTQSMVQLFGGKNFTIGGVTISYLQITMLATTVVLTTALSLFIKKSRMGMAIRATSQDQNAASLMGINLDTVISVTFAIGSGMAAVGGMLVSTYYSSVYPTMGWMAGLKGFVAAILGGLGSLSGAAIAGVVIGLAENLAAGYIDAGYKDAIAFIILILVLLVRPQGLFGSGKGGKKV